MNCVPPLNIPKNKRSVYPCGGIMEGSDTRFAEVHQFVIANFALNECTLVERIAAQRTLFHIFSAGAA